ncbi:MAG: hypothetical protein ACRCXC_12025 [Legionella sp.]
MGLVVAYAAYRIHDAYQKQLDDKNQEHIAHDLYRLIEWEQPEDRSLEFCL